MAPPTPEETATAKKVVSVITKMIPMGETPPWMINTQSVFTELSNRMPASGVSVDEFARFIEKFKASQSYLSDNVKMLKGNWEEQNPATALQSLKADILAAYPGARGGRRTRKTRRTRHRRSRRR